MVTSVLSDEPFLSVRDCFIEYTAELKIREIFKIVSFKTAAGAASGGPWGYMKAQV